MIASPKDYNNIFLSKATKARLVEICVTNKCNIRCAHCYQNSGAQDYDDRIPIDAIDMLFKKLKTNDHLVVASGGECTVAIDRVEHIAEKCRAANIPLVIGTNGLWIRDKTIRDKIKNEIKPAMIRVSVDVFHQRFVPIDAIYELIDFFEDSPTKIYGGTVWKYECSKEDAEKFDSLKIPFETMPLVKIGRASGVKQERLKVGEIISCQSCGINLLNDGTVNSLCDLGAASCKIGTIYDESLDIEAYMDYLNEKQTPRKKIEEGDCYHDIYDYCRTNNVFVCDKKWCNPEIAETTSHTNIMIRSRKQADIYYSRFYENS